MPPKKRQIRIDKLSKEMHPTQRIVRAVKFAEHKKTQPLSASLPKEELGLLIWVIRRQQQSSLDRFAASLNISPETLIALEAGILPGPRLCEILPAILDKMGVSLSKLAETLQKKKPEL